MSTVSSLDPVAIRAAMCRMGIAPHQLRRHEDPEHGWVTPLDSWETQADVRTFMHDLWQACIKTEEQTNE